MNGKESFLAQSQALAGGQDRMSSNERRNDLMDIALDILRERGHAGVSIGVVAERAGVTRTLVYKHFANREDLVDEVYRREADTLHRAISERVQGQEGFEPRLRAFIQAVLEAVESHGWLFDSRDPQAREVGYRKEQKQRDRRTVRAFAAMASEEFGLSLREATSAMAILLSGIASLRLQAHVMTGASDRAFLENLYMEMTLGALGRLGAKRGDAPRAPGSGSDNDGEADGDFRRG